MSTTTQPPKPKRRWYQFSLKTLLLVMVVGCFGFAWIGWGMRRAQENRAQMPEDWNLTQIKNAAYKFGESRVLAWSITEDVRRLRVESCLVGNIDDDSDGKRYWRVFVLYRDAKTKGAEWQISLMHASYPKGHKLWPGIWHTGMERFPKQPTDAELLAYLNGPTVFWSFIVKTNTSSLTTEDGWRPDKMRLVDSHVDSKNWKWFAGQPPSERFREVP